MNSLTVNWKSPTCPTGYKSLQADNKKNSEFPSTFLPSSWISSSLSSLELSQHPCSTKYSSPFPSSNVPSQRCPTGLHVCLLNCPTVSLRGRSQVEVTSIIVFSMSYKWGGRDWVVGFIKIKVGLGCGSVGEMFRSPAPMHNPRWSGLYLQF